MTNAKTRNYIKESGEQYSVSTRRGRNTIKYKSTPTPQQNSRTTSRRLRQLHLIKTGLQKNKKNTIYQTRTYLSQKNPVEVIGDFDDPFLYYKEITGETDPWIFGVIPDCPNEQYCTWLYVSKMTKLLTSLQYENRKEFKKAINDYWNRYIIGYQEWYESYTQNG